RARWAIASAIAAIAVAALGSCFRRAPSIGRQRSADVVALLELSRCRSSNVSLVRSCIDQLASPGRPFLGLMFSFKTRRAMLAVVISSRNAGNPRAVEFGPGRAYTLPARARSSVGRATDF